MLRLFLLVVAIGFSTQGCIERDRSAPADGDTRAPDQQVGSCGDGACAIGEGCVSCEQDCGPCSSGSSTCGDGACGADEDCSRCEQDCGTCPPPLSTCGDGACGADEDCSRCEQDCGACGFREKPNIVFILADDLGYGDLGTYDHLYARTPNIDQLAAEGTQFRRFYATGVTCSPSRTGFMTSRHSASYANYPARFGFRDRMTITKLLNDAGYATGHFGKWHIGPQDEAVDGVYGIDEVKVIGADKDSQSGRDFPVFEAAMRFMEDHDDRPFYVNVWGHATHYPVNPSDSLADEFNEVNCRPADFGEHMRQRFKDCETIGGDIDQSMRNYLGDVYGLDVGVGHLLRKIDELGLRNDTIVVFSSDQGPAPIHTTDTFGDVAEQNMLGYAGGLRGTKHTQYEGGVRSPFIIRWPHRVPANKVNQVSIFSGMDWLPTVCSIAGVSIDAAWYEGEDVSDIWLGSNRSRTNPLLWRTSNAKATVSVLQGDWKLHVRRDDIELYDLSSDETETKDVAAANHRVVTRLLAKRDEWVFQLPNEYAKKENDSPKQDPVTKPNVVGPANLHKP